MPAPARLRHTAAWTLALAALAMIGAVLLSTSSDGEPLPECRAAGVACLQVEVLRRYPHDRHHFTQGLEYHDGRLYEGTGGYGTSVVAVYELSSGRGLARVALAPGLFGEGLTLSGSELLQITWQEGTLLRWQPDTLAPLGTLRYRGDGWGLCRAGDRLVMSDGSSRLTLRDPASFEPTGQLDVTLGGRALSGLNELECVDGAVYANLWPSERIARIDGATGEVTALIDAGGLLGANERRGTDVLNGIAWRPDAGTFLITGKNWPYLYEVQFVPEQ